MDVGFIGTGRITRRLVRGLDRAGHTVTVTRRSESVSSDLVAEDPAIDVVETAQEVVDRSDAVFVCVDKEVARGLLPEIAFSPGQAIISAMAGVSLDELRTAVAPASDVSVTIPMPLIEQGGCPLPVYPASEKLEVLYGKSNPVIPVTSEAALEPFWAVTGAMAGVIDELRTITAWLGEHIGDMDAAERYVTSLYGGQLASLATDRAGRLDSAVNDLSIEGGLNAAMHRHIGDSGHYEVLREGLDMLYGRVRGE